MKQRINALSLPLIISAICIILFVPQSAETSLLPQEIVVLVNENSAESIRIGELYIKLRKIPATNLIKVKVNTGDNISRENYNRFIASPLRKRLKILRSQGKMINCVVTTFGIPLRISASRPQNYSKSEVDKYKNAKTQKKNELARLEEEAKKNKHLDKDLKEARDGLSRLRMYLNQLTGHDTVAAVDSELSLALIADYDLAGWKPNPYFLYLKTRVSYPDRILMVSRLDAPTPELVENMIRTSIEVEKAGLSGKIYLDARGKTGNDAYSIFDNNIRQAAEILKKSSLPVILDNKSKLFGPGEAPGAALYCGWYSLGKYIDAFDWVKGAVGYHVASSEARSLHDPKKKYWAKVMLEKGVIATIGPVTEPYLSAFPPPTLFFPLLISGNYTLVEVYAMSNPLISWQMILVGDPLYNPFKNNPALILKNAPPPPA